MLGLDRELPYVLDDVDRYADGRWERLVELRRDERGAARLRPATCVLGIPEAALVGIRELRVSTTGPALVPIRIILINMTDFRDNTTLVCTSCLSMPVLLRSSLDSE